eukprot:7382284-Prymnesium_polylepis.1
MPPRWAAGAAAAFFFPPRCGRRRGRGRRLGRGRGRFLLLQLTVALQRREVRPHDGQQVGDQPVIMPAPHECFDLVAVHRLKTPPRPRTVSPRSPAPCVR